MTHILRGGVRSCHAPSADSVQGRGGLAAGRTPQRAVRAAVWRWRWGAPAPGGTICANLSHLPFRAVASYVIETFHITQFTLLLRFSLYPVDARAVHRGAQSTAQIQIPKMANIPGLCSRRASSR